MLSETDAGTGLMHESMHVDDPSRYTREWFSWANALFCEWILDIPRQRQAMTQTYRPTYAACNNQIKPALNQFCEWILDICGYKIVRQQSRGYNVWINTKEKIEGEITMAVQYRKLTENDLETFIEMRIRQLREEGATEEIDLEPALFVFPDSNRG